MKKTFLFATLLLLLQITSHAQIEVAKLIGKNSADYKPGFGAFLKFSYPVTDAADISLEAGCLFFFEKGDYGYGIGYFPAKLGYRYTFNGSGTGLYAEPQLGYNVYGINSYSLDGYGKDEKFNGIVAGVGVGYLFPAWGSMQFDLGLRYETVQYKGNSLHSVGLRLARNFSFKRRETE